MELFARNMHVSSMEDGNSSYEVFATVMELRSDTQSKVRRLTCVVWDNSQDMLSVTLGKIRQSLGDFFSFNLAR